MLAQLTVACIVSAASAFAVSPNDLYSLLGVERGEVGVGCAQPDSEGRRACTSTDVPHRADCGPFQINEVHAKEFGGIFRMEPRRAMERIRDDGCLNAYASAYLLAKRTREAGGDRHEGLGRYRSALRA